MSKSAVEELSLVFEEIKEKSRKVPDLEKRIEALEDRVKALEDHNKAESKAYDDIHNLMEAHNKKMHDLFRIGRPKQ